MTFVPGDREPIDLRILEFDARFVPRRDGTARFRVETSFTDNGQETAILSTLGGAAVEIVIGTETGLSVPLSVETVGGQPPDDT